MRTAIISDIHGSLEALGSVLQDIDNSQIDSIVCLGDLVGYGPQPDEVVLKIMERGIRCVLGNHDMAIYDEAEYDQFDVMPARSVVLTRELLSKNSIEYIKLLPNTIIEGNTLFVHGAPPDSVTTYIYELDRDELATTLQELPQNIVFVGHLHWLLKYELGDEGLVIEHLSKGHTHLDKEKKYLFNVGSVGQPRDGTPHAKYAILDESNDLIELRFVAYDVLKTVSLIENSDFPNHNGTRLIKGK